MHPNYDRRGRWEEKIYYKFDEKYLEKHITQMEKDLNTHNANISIEEFNRIVERVAEKTLMSKYKRRLLKNNQRKSDASWVNDEIRNEIKKRKKIIKKRETVMMLQKGNYILNRKKIVQTKKREQINIYEMKITNDIRQDRRRFGII